MRAAFFVDVRTGTVLQGRDTRAGWDAIDDDVRKMWAAAVRLSAIGLEFGVAVAIGYAAGWWLDRKLGTGPYLTVLLLLCGVAAGFKALWRATRDYRRMTRSGDGDSAEREE